MAEEIKNPMITIYNHGEGWKLDVRVEVHPIGDFQYANKRPHVADYSHAHLVKMGFVFDPQKTSAQTWKELRPMLISKLGI